MRNFLYKFRFFWALLFILVIFFSFLFVRKNKMEASFYFWRTSFNMSQSEKDLLAYLGVNKIYIRYFDLTYSPETNGVEITGLINFTKKWKIPFNTIPVVFISNKVLINTPLNKTEEMANRIYRMITTVSEENDIAYNEIQLDCDWTESTRDKFFKIAEIFRIEGKRESKSISATIRLHQVKYYKRTGIPPVDRGMLMFYNMGTYSKDTTSISIYDTTESLKYIDYIKQYPLVLDIALPIFSDAIQFRGDKPVNILSKSFISILREDSHFTKLSNNYYTADSSFFFRGNYFLKDDLFKIEETGPEATISAADLISEHLSKNSRTVALFDLDSNNIKKYKYEDFKKIFNYFY